MTLKINQAVSATVAAPIAEAAAWPCAVDMAPIDLAQAVPNYDPAPELLDYLSKAVRDARSAFYTPILGLPQLREALAADLSSSRPRTVSAS